jgi:hypothetical protein
LDDSVLRADTADDDGVAGEVVFERAPSAAAAAAAAAEGMSAGAVDVVGSAGV